MGLPFASLTRRGALASQVDRVLGAVKQRERTWAVFRGAVGLHGQGWLMWV